MTVPLFTLDFETYYDKLYSLSRMSTEEYVYDDRFEIIMVSLKRNDEETIWFTANTEQEYREWLMMQGVHRGAVVAHNMMFDGLILDRLGVPMPPILLDTLSMAQATLKPHHRSISLDSCLKHLDSPIRKKGYVHNMLGRRLHSLSTQELHEYADYCVTDTDGTHWLFHSLKDRLPKSEFEIIDTTLRMYLQPAFQLDATLLKGLLKDTRNKKKRLMEALPDWCKKSQLSSNPQFAELLKTKLGIDPPLKISPTTGRTTFAFAKNDEGWKDLEDEWSDDPIVGSILAARLGVKSTIAESRAERFVDIAENFGKLRVPLRYYAAHTGRYGGMEKINCQNLTRIDYKNPSRNQLRYALTAPKGSKVVAIDLSQIEARINAWLAGCPELLEVFRTGGDPYCAFASKLYRRPITKADKKERFVGKTCFTADTKVLTQRGPVPIIEVQTTDMVWDGESWVKHYGVVAQGEKTVLRQVGVGATPDHEIYVGSSKHDWSEVQQSPYLLLSAIRSALGQSWRSFARTKATTLAANASAALRKLLTGTTYSVGSLLAVTGAPKRRHPLNGTSSTKMPSPTTSTAADYSTGSQARLAGAITAGTRRTPITEVGVSPSVNSGETIDMPFSPMFRALVDGTIRLCRLTASTLMATTSRGISDSLRRSRTQTTNDLYSTFNERLTSYENVYDIANAGPNHRFTILSEAGPIVVSNCILGLGYGMGAPKLKATFRKDGEKIKLGTAYEYVNTYRESYHEIPANWRYCDHILTQIADGGLINIGPCMASKDRITLPNGMAIWYNNLTWQDNKKYKGWTFEYAGRVKMIWGGTVVENLCQALARIILMDHASDIRRETGFRPKLNVHDELVYIIPETVAEDFLETGTEIMHRSSDWCPDLPVAAEGAMGDSYGDCK